jgi:hypothetical protein
MQVTIEVENEDITPGHFTREESVEAALSADQLKEANGEERTNFNTPELRQQVGR